MPVKSTSSARKTALRRPAAGQKTALRRPSAGQKTAVKRPARKTASKALKKTAPKGRGTRVKAKKGVTRASAKKRGRTRARGSWWPIPVICLMLMLLGLSALAAVTEWGNYRRFLVMRDAVEENTYYKGVLVENYDISSLNIDGALKYWEENIEPHYLSRSVTLRYQDRTWKIDVADIGYQSDYRDVLLNAWGNGRSGAMRDRYSAIVQMRQSALRYDVTRQLFDAGALRRITDEIAASLSSKAADAKLLGFDFSEQKFQFSSEAVGSGVDADALFHNACEVLLNGSGEINIEVTTLYPTVTREQLASKYGLITSAVTNASSSNKDRLTNLRLACDAINGTVVNAGDTFSFNGVVGERKKSRGYKVATVYNNGELDQDVGGGVCQVSTTLWNAAMKANCEIVERNAHSRPVTYVDKGKDATVSWTSQDMKFKNTSSSPMYIVGYVTDTKRVYFEIYGELLKDGMTITVEGKTTKTIKPGEPSYVANPVLASGEKVTVSEARTGYRAVAYRVYWDASGGEINRELLCESYYRAASAVIEYGP